MRTTTHLALAAFAVAAVAAAGGGPATADPPKCPQSKTTCADSLKGRTGKKAGRVEYDWKVEQGELSKRRKGLKGK